MNPFTIIFYKITAAGFCLSKSIFVITPYQIAAQPSAACTEVQGAKGYWELPLTLFLIRDIVWFGTMGTAARQRAVCLVDVSGSLHKWLDDDHGRAGGGCGRGLMLRDRSRAAAR